MISMVIDRYHHLVCEETKRIPTNVAWEIRKQNGMAATQAGCMAVPTSKASEHRSELNDRINKWWRWGRGRVDADAETRQLEN